MPTGDNRCIHSLEIEVEAELAVVESSRAGDMPVVPEAEWLFDPTEIEREEIGLRNLLGAVEALEGDSQPGPAVQRLPHSDDGGQPS